MPSPRRDHDRLRTYRRTLGRLSIAMLVAWALLLAPLPYALAAGVVGVIVIALLVQVMTRGWRAGQRGTAVFTALVGIPACLALLGSTLLSAIFYGPLHELQECQHDALTEASLTQCREQGTTAITERLSALLGP